MVRKTTTIFSRSSRMAGRSQSRRGPGMSMSSTATWRRQPATSARPFRHPQLPPRHELRRLFDDLPSPCRKIGWSSAIRTRIGLSLFASWFTGSLESQLQSYQEQLCDHFAEYGQKSLLRSPSHWGLSVVTKRQAGACRTLFAPESQVFNVGIQTNRFSAPNTCLSTRCSL